MGDPPPGTGKTVEVTHSVVVVVLVELQELPENALAVCTLLTTAQLLLGVEAASAGDEVGGTAVCGIACTLGRLAVVLAGAGGFPENQADQP